LFHFLNLTSVICLNLNLLESWLCDSFISKEGETKIGSEEEGNNKHDILLKGLGLESQHCSILLESGVATLIPFNGALCWVNGQQIDKPTRLFQGM
jgi:hypothetical protein